MVLNGGIFGGLPLVIIALRSASLIFWTSSEAKSLVFSASFPLPSGPWQAAHLALKVASVAAVSAFTGELSGPTPASRAAPTAIARRVFLVVCILLSLRWFRLVIGDLTSSQSFERSF